MTITNINTRLLQRNTITMLFLLLVIIFWGCKSNNNATIASDSLNDVNSESADTTTVPMSDNDKSSVVNVNFILPSPDEILNEILPSDIEINIQHVNPKTNIQKYVDAKSQALNLGVYLADFAYLNLSDNKTNALDYFKVIRDLAQKVGIYGFFDEKLFNRIQNNLTNKDSLQLISKEIYYSMLNILESSNRNNVYALISSGALIETMYLSSMIVTNSNDYKTIATKIFEQKFVFDNFFEFANQYADDNDVKSTMVLFENLKKIIDSATSKDVEKTVVRDKKDHIIIGGGQEFIIDERVFKDFKLNITRTRNDIINVGNKK